MPYFHSLRRKCARSLADLLINNNWISMTDILILFIRLTDQPKKWNEIISTVIKPVHCLAHILDGAFEGLHFGLVFLTKPSQSCKRISHDAFRCHFVSISSSLLTPKNQQKNVFFLENMLLLPFCLGSSFSCAEWIWTTKMLHY